MNAMRKTASFALALTAGLASYVALAQEPYYDPVRDVWVTPPAQAPVYGSRVVQDARPIAENTFELMVRGGKLQNGPFELVVPHGVEVTLTVDSDLPDTLSIGGYNYRVAFEAGQPMVLTFKAERPGVFPIVLGRTGRQIATLEVAPPITSRR